MNMPSPADNFGSSNTADITLHPAQRAVRDLIDWLVMWSNTSLVAVSHGNGCGDLSHFSAGKLDQLFGLPVGALRRHADQPEESHTYRVLKQQRTMICTGGGCKQCYDVAPVRLDWCSIHFFVTHPPSSQTMQRLKEKEGTGVFIIGTRTLPQVWADFIGLSSTRSFVSHSQEELACIIASNQNSATILHDLLPDTLANWECGNTES